MHQWIQSVAGSGKTTLLINKLLDLLKINTKLTQYDISSNSDFDKNSITYDSKDFILCLSFARTSVRKMQELLVSLVKKQLAVKYTNAQRHNQLLNSIDSNYDITNIEFTTLHSLAASIVQEEVISSEYIKNCAWQQLFDLSPDKEIFRDMFIENPDWTSWVENYSEFIAQTYKKNDLYGNAVNQDLRRHFIDHNTYDKYINHISPESHNNHLLCQYNAQISNVRSSNDGRALVDSGLICTELTSEEIEKLKSKLAQLNIDLEESLQNDLSAPIRKKLGDAAKLFDRYKSQHYLRHEQEFTRALISVGKLWQDIMNYLHDNYNLASYDGLLKKGILALQSKSYTCKIPKYILIDEAQDLTGLQWEFIHGLFAESLSLYPDATITIVGDPNQIIYGFQGSGIDVWNNGLQWWNTLPGVKDYIVRTCCYRCGAAIIKLVNLLFTPSHMIESGHIGQSWVEIYEPSNEKYIENLLSYILAGKFKHEEVLILVKRRGVLSRSIIDIFNRAGVKISGLSSDLTSAIEVIEFFVNATDLTNDFAIFQALECIFCSEQSIRKENMTFERLQQDIRLRKGSVFETLNDLHPEISKLLYDLSYAKNDCGKFLYILSNYINIDHKITQLAAVWCCTGSGCVEEFIIHGKTQSQLHVEPVTNHIRLLTIHAAKGLQSKYVIIADAYDSPYKIVRDIDLSYATWPNENNLARRKELTLRDSKNLLYVAMTRAECGLVICGNGNRHKQSFADEVSLALEGIQGVIEHETPLGACKRLELL